MFQNRTRVLPEVNPSALEVTFSSSDLRTIKFPLRVTVSSRDPSLSEGSRPSWRICAFYGQLGKCSVGYRRELWEFVILSHFSIMTIDPVQRSRELLPLFLSSSTSLKWRALFSHQICISRWSWSTVGRSKGGFQDASDYRSEKCVLRRCLWIRQSSISWKVS